MVRNDFKSLGLDNYGVEIHIDDLSKEEIIDKIESENFNRINYLKMDYQNFKAYLKTPSYPSHMDYMNSDYAPNLLKFMKIKIGSKKTNSYYGFLKGIEEEDLPVFSEEQIACINYLSSLLPLVREHEVFGNQKFTKAGETALSHIEANIQEEIPGFKPEQLEHALRFLEDGNAVKIEVGEVHLCGEREQEYEAYLQDLLNYGLTQYEARHADTKDDFLLWQDYRQDQVLLKILENPKHNQYGTYYKNGNMYVFAGLKKDASLDDHLKYNDKFLSPDVFQWESIAHISAKDEALQRAAKRVLVFVRKVSAENGITLPYTYIGTGHLENPRKDATTNGSILYDIHMDNPLPQELQEDFQWME